MTPLEYLGSLPNVPAPVVKAARQARLYCTHAEADKALDQLAVRLTARYQQANPRVQVARSGIFFAGLLLPRIALPMAIHWPDGSDALEPGSHGAVWSLDFVQPFSEEGGVTGIGMVAAPGRDADLWSALPGVSEPGTWLGLGADIAGYGANLPDLYRVADS